MSEFAFCGLIALIWLTHILLWGIYFTASHWLEGLKRKKSKGQVLADQGWGMTKEEIVAKNMKLPDEHSDDVVAMLDAQESLINQFVQIGGTREEFYEMSRASQSGQRILKGSIDARL